MNTGSGALSATSAARSRQRAARRPLRHAARSRVATCRLGSLVWPKNRYQFEVWLWRILLKKWAARRVGGRRAHELFVLRQALASRAAILEHGAARRAGRADASEPIGRATCA